jgi:GPI mannosyltransferase 3
MRLLHRLRAAALERFSAIADWPEDRYFRLCLIASGLLFLSCAIFSVGSYHVDEYSDVVEYAATKLGISDAAELPWGYRAELRSWLQPAIYVGVARTAELVGIHRPLTLYLLFRLVTAAIAWSSLWTLIHAGRGWIADEAGRRRLYTFAALLWLLPYLGARTSAETMSTSALCFGIACLEWRSIASMRALGLMRVFGLALAGGAALTLCAVFRYPSGIMAAGAGCWYLGQGPKRLSLVCGILVGAVLALALGGIADWWGYGHPTFPVAAFVDYNFIRGVSNDYGTSPFFGYLYLPLRAAAPMAPVVFVLVLATIIAWVDRPLSAATWSTAPYVLLLSIVPHKEVRFLFPLAVFQPFFLTFALAARIAVGTWLASFVRWLATGYRRRILYLLNLCALLCVALLPQWSRAGLYAQIENESAAANGPLDVVVVHAQHTSPYVYIGNHMGFLEPKNLRWNLDPPVSALRAEQSRGAHFLALIDIPVQSTDSADWLRAHCNFLWSTYPRWLEPYDFNHWEERSYWWELYRCDFAHSRQ